MASEALANAAKHAHASAVTLSAARQDGHLVICIRDDGGWRRHPIGGLGSHRHDGPRGALGGSLRVESAAGHGTVVTAELPCES